MSAIYSAGRLSEISRSAFQRPGSTAAAPAAGDYSTPNAAGAAGGRVTPSISALSQHSNHAGRVTPSISALSQHSNHAAGGAGTGRVAPSISNLSQHSNHTPAQQMNTTTTTTSSKLPTPTISLAEADVMNTAVDHLEKELSRRPEVDLGGCLMAVDSVSAIIKKSIATEAAKAGQWRLPDVTIKLFPAMYGFLEYCHNQANEHIRTVELQVINLAYYLLVAIAPNTQLKPVIHATLIAHLPFLLHAARKQLTMLQTSAVRVVGDSPSLWEPPQLSAGNTVTLLTEVDGYMWLSLTVLLKLDTPSLGEWMTSLHRVPHSLPFTSVLMVIILELCAMYLQRKSAQYLAVLLLVLDSGRNGARQPFPLPALDSNPPKVPPAKALHLTAAVRLTLRRIPSLLTTLLGTFGDGRMPQPRNDDEPSPSHPPVQPLPAAVGLSALRVFTCLTWISIVRELSEDMPPEYQTSAGHVAPEPLRGGSPSPSRTSSQHPGSGADNVDRPGSAQIFSSLSFFNNPVGLGKMLSASTSPHRGAGGSPSRVDMFHSAEHAGLLPLQHEEAFLRFGQTLLDKTTDDFQSVAALQLFRCSFLLILRSGLRETTTKPVLPFTKTLAAAMIECASSQPATELEVTAALVVDEFNTVRNCGSQLYVTSRPILMAFRRLQEFVIENQEVAVPKDSIAARIGALSLAPGGNALKHQAQELESWRNVVKVAALLVEAEDPHNEDVPDSLWRLAVYYMNIQKGQYDVGFVEPPVGDAAKIMNTIPLDWEIEDDLDEVILGQRGKDAPRLPATLNASLRFLNALVLACLQTQDFASAAGYCDAFGALLSHKETTSAVSASLFCGATKLFMYCHMYEDAVRVGQIAMRQLTLLCCDLHSAELVTAMVQEAASRL